MASQLKYCHACHNEFYDAEICQRCGSDFVENFEETNDPASFYEDEPEDETPDSDLFSYGSTSVYPRPPIPAPLQQRQQQQSSSRLQDTTGSTHDPFGFGSGQNPSSSSSTSLNNSTNPMYVDGYRNILEHLFGGMNQAMRLPNQGYPPYPPQSSQAWGTPPNPPRSPFAGTGQPLGASPPPPQQQPGGTTSRFHYSVTTYGPGGITHHSSRSNSPLPEGRQIAVPTLQDFLGMHTHPGYTTTSQPQMGYDDPFGMMLRHMMQSLGPMHGNPGDYLRPGMTMDDFITEFMNQNQTSTAPPPATNQTLDSLPRFKADKAIVDGGSECTVCKDGFKLGDDAIRLPCLHVFHEECILPWLKINGSCPVCRHTLDGSPQTDTPPNPPNNTRSPPSSSSPPEPPGHTWSLSNLFHFGGGSPSRHDGSGSGNPGTSSSAGGGRGGNTQGWRGYSMPSDQEDLD